MAHEYEERFVGYGKDRVSWNYELAAKRVRFWVPPDAFLVHFETHDLEEASTGGGGGDDAAAAGGGGGSSGSGGTGGAGGSGSRVRPKKQYGHHPTDWMLGESCWPFFRDRVQAQYNFSVYTCHQTMIDGLHRGRFEACASETERVCVRPFCTPRTTVLAHPLPPTAGRPPRVSASPARNLTSYPDELATTLAVSTLAGGARAEMTKPEMTKPEMTYRYPGPRLVMLGCEGCGIPELWRILVAARAPAGRLQVALTNPGEPSCMHVLTTTPPPLPHRSQ
jgi:hypothetical protein